MAPFVVAAFGIGMTIGSLVVPRLADRAQMPTAGATLLWTAVALALYPLAAGNVWWISLDVALHRCHHVDDGGLAENG